MKGSEGRQTQEDEAAAANVISFSNKISRDPIFTHVDVGGVRAVGCRERKHAIGGRGGASAGDGVGANKIATGTLLDDVGVIGGSLALKSNCGRAPTDGDSR
jgi:hypothetical protein